ncbi:DUF6221 family protein [Streptomyces sp. NPDC017454]|uniref:DUF6221 family protein n=1 Tax=Streptomyces sp. NPDC017454 TaxID=3364997 RepID=UPI0037BDA2B8
MSEIADFLRARYRQEVHVARLIAKTTGSERWKADWRQLSYSHFDAQVATEYGEPVFDGFGNVGTAEFVSGYSPARVLADLEAKLAIVDLMDRTLDAAEGDTEVDHYGGLGAAEETLRLLAQPFAGHPDHKGEEWAP